MKLSVLQDNQYTDVEKEKRLKQIDIDIHHAEEIMKNDLEYRGLLIQFIKYEFIGYEQDFHTFL